MPVQTRRQTAAAAAAASAASAAPAPKALISPKAKRVYVRTLPEKTEEQKKADEEYYRQSEQRYIDRRNKIIEENNYANSEVFAVLREARQALGESKFMSLIFLLDALAFDSNYIVEHHEYDEEEGLLLLPWFRRLFDLLASGKTTFELKYLPRFSWREEYDFEKDEEYTKRVEFRASWEHMDDMVRVHFTKIFPISTWAPPLSKIVF